MENLKSKEVEVRYYHDFKNYQNFGATINFLGFVDALKDRGEIKSFQSSLFLELKNHPSTDLTVV